LKIKSDGDRKIGETLINAEFLTGWSIFSISPTLC